MISIFKKLGKNALGFASGLNWWKYGAYAVVLAAIIGGSYYKGKHDCELTQSEKETAAAFEHVRAVVTGVNERLPVIQEREVASASQKAQIEELKRKLDYETNNRPERPSCDLSDAELKLVQDLAKQTHARK